MTLNERSIRREQPFLADERSFRSKKEQLSRVRGSKLDFGKDERFKRLGALSKEQVLHTQKSILNFIAELAILKIDFKKYIIPNIT